MSDANKTSYIKLHVEKLVNTGHGSPFGVPNLGVYSCIMQDTCDTGYEVCFITLSAAHNINQMMMCDAVRMTTRYSSFQAFCSVS